MKKFFTAVIAWIKAHVWQSIVIGVASCAVIAIAITLPIVLSKDKAPANDTPAEPTPEPTPITYVVSKEDVSGGTITLSETGAFEVGKEIYVTAEANEGYKFGGITINGELKAETISYNFTVLKDLADNQNKIVVSAIFEQNSPTPEPTTYAVSKQDVDGGTITLSDVGAFEAGKEIYVTAEADACYTFGGITINGVVQTESTPYTFTVSRDLSDDQNKIVVSAIFEQNSPTPTEYAESATIDGPTFVVEGETITLTAEPIPAGSEFQHEFQWSITSGLEYAEIVESTATTVTIRGIIGDQQVEVKADDNFGIAVTITITVEPAE